MLTIRLAPLTLLVACSLDVGGTKSELPVSEGPSTPDAASVGESDASAGEIDAGGPDTHPCTGSDAGAGCTAADKSDAMVEAPCPSNTEKASPGVCGCGTPDTDSDDDGVIDCIDMCIGFGDDSERRGCICDAARQTCGNRPPTVTLVEPSSDKVESDELTIRAEAHDQDGTIDRVTLFVDGKRIRDERQAPYVWGEGNSSDKELQRLSTGVHTIEVEAADDQGATARAQMELTILP